MAVAKHGSERYLAAGLLALCLGTLAWAVSHVRIVRVSFLARGVEVRHPATVDAAATDWAPALLNAPVTEAEMVRTVAEGEAEIQLECGSALRLGPNSEMSFPALSLRDDGVRTTRVALTRGTAFFTLRRSDSADFQVSAGEATLTIPSGAVWVNVDAKVPWFELLAGHATVRDGRGSFDLRKDARLELPRSGIAVWAELAAADGVERWSRARDQAFAGDLVNNGPKPPPIGLVATAPPEPSAADVLNKPGAPGAALPRPADPTVAPPQDPTHIFSDLAAPPLLAGAQAPPAAGARPVPACSNP